MRMTHTAALLSVAALLVSPAPALADDGRAQELLDQATELYEARSNDRSVTTNAASLAEQAAKEASDEELKYRALVLASRSHYWNGMKVAENDADGRKAAFGKALDNADLARCLGQPLGKTGDARERECKNNRFWTIADAQYYFAIALGRWGLANGIGESLGRRNEVRLAAGLAIENETLDFDAGKEIDGFGPNRTLGRLEFKLPPLLGSNKKALRYLREAVDGAPNHALNVVYLAEVLEKENEKHHGKSGCQLLAELLAKDPVKLGQERNRVPETLDEFAEGAAVKQRLCK